MFFNFLGKQRKVLSAYLKENGEWKLIRSLYAKNNASWKKDKEYVPQIARYDMNFIYDLSQTITKTYSGGYYRYGYASKLDKTYNNIINITIKLALTENSSIDALGMWRIYTSPYESGGFETFVDSGLTGFLDKLGYSNAIDISGKISPRTIRRIIAFRENWYSGTTSTYTIPVLGYQML